MKRVKQIRMSLAWGLVMFSDLRMTDIAERVGYARVHEFSRDYRRAYGRSPTHDRLAERGPARDGAAVAAVAAATRSPPDRPKKSTLTARRRHRR